MIRRPFLPLLALALLAVLVLPAPARAESVHERLIASQAESVVSVKYVVTLKVSRAGETRDMERSGSALGVVVSPEGLVVVPGEAFSPPMRFPGVEVTATPSSIRIVFPGDPKEYDAVLGATDSRIGLAFVRIKDLEGKVVKPLDFANATEPTIGMTAYGVSRLPEGFDYAPYCDTADVVGWVTKPRKMWLIQGRFIDGAHPLFDAEGKVLGILTTQEGVGDANRLPFLLPVPVAVSTIERAGREAEKVLEEAKEKEAEGAAGEPTGKPEEGAGSGEETPPAPGGEPKPPEEGTPPEEPAPGEGAR